MDDKEDMTVVPDTQETRPGAILTYDLPSAWRCFCL